MRLERQQTRQRHLLHVFASFGYGGVPIRICDIINGLPAGFRHTVVALDGCFDARRRLASHTTAEFRSLKLPKYNLFGSLRQIKHFIDELAPDLLLTYNWGAIEPALANRLLGACEHIHFESGFGIEEGNGQLWRRNLFRRLALARARKVVVPSSTLMKIASDAWSIEPARLLEVPNGVDFSRYAGEPGRRDSFAPFGPEITIVGTVAPLRPEKNVGRLLRAFAALPEAGRYALLIAGDGVEAPLLRQLANDLGIAERTLFLGHVDDVPAVLRGIDIFALSSDTEQMPNSLLQAMAAGRPVAAVDVGDVARIVAEQNRPFVVPRANPGELTAAIAVLAQSPRQRRIIGAQNQKRVKTEYSLETMIAAYSKLLAAS